MYRVVLVAAAGLAAGLAGCSSSARFVDRTPTGGVVGVPDFNHRQDAISLIERKGLRAYTIVEEGEVPTGGTVTKATAESGTGSVFTRVFSWFTGTRQTLSSETTTEKTTEYRIRYEVMELPSSPSAMPTQPLSPLSSPKPPPPGVTPTGLQSKLTNFDINKDCRL